MAAQVTNVETQSDGYESTVSIEVTRIPAGSMIDGTPSADDIPADYAAGLRAWLHTRTDAPHRKAAT